jgi:hypothetical protein
MLAAILYTDFLTPIAILVLLFMSTRWRPAADQSAGTVSATHIEEAIESSPTPRIEDELERLDRRCESLPNLDGGPCIGGTGRRCPNDHEK